MKLRSDFLPYALPSLSHEEADAVVRILQSGWLTTGKETKTFEKEFAAFTGTEHALGVSSCTAALHLALMCAGVGPGDEVITTPLTFAATVNQIIHCGAVPVLTDIDPLTLNINPSLIEAVITPRTKAVIAVHFAGLPADMAAINRIAQKNGLTVIEDAAHAAGSSLNAVKCGALSPYGCFSFYATKNCTTGEGGMLTFRNATLYEKAGELALHGITRDAWKRYHADGNWQYDINHAGYKYNMTDIEAAIGRVQLKKLDGFNDIRRAYAAQYDDSFKDLDFKRPVTPSGVTHSTHLYTIRVNRALHSIHRNDFINILKTKYKIGTAVHFIPVNQFTFYRNYFKKNGGQPHLPVSDAIADELVSLPLYPAMTPGDIEYVHRAVCEIVG